MKRLLGLGAAWLAVGATSAFAQDVDVVWDSRGVAHVKASTDEGLFYGQGYACAKNRLGQMHRVRMAAQGRLSEIQAEANDCFGDSKKTPMENDRQMRLVRLYEEATERFDELDAQTKSALQAYADGVNAYIAELVTDLNTMPQPGRYLPDILDQLYNDILAFPSTGFPVWTPIDSIACTDWWTYDFAGVAWKEHDNLQMNEQIATVQVEDDFAHIVETDYTNLTAAQQFLASNYTNPPSCDTYSPTEGITASNAVVIAGDKTQSTKPIVWADPKLPMMNPGLLWEIHLTNTDPTFGFNARGVNMPGTPGLLLGFNGSMAWGATALGMDRADLLQVKLDPNDSDRYMYDDDNDGTATSFPIDESVETIVNFDGPDRTLTVRWTKYGPIVTPLVDNVTIINPGTPNAYYEDEYVLRHPTNSFPGRHSIQAFIRMLRATTAEELRELSKYWVSPSFHCVFADDGGTIGYTPLAAVPVRGDSRDNASFQAVPAFDDPDDDWQRAIPNDVLPWTLKTSGVLVSANHRPAGCWYPLPLYENNVSSRPGTRSLRLKEYFEDTTTLHTVSTVEELSVDPIAFQQRELARAALELVQEGYTSTFNTNAIFALTDANELPLWATGVAPDGPYESRVSAPGYGYISLYLVPRIDPVLDPLLTSVYEDGTVGALRLMWELSDRDYGTNSLDHDDGDIDQAISEWVVRQFNKAANDAQDVYDMGFDPRVKFCRKLPYYGFDALWILTGTANVMKDLDMRNLPNGKAIDCINRETLWDADGRLYSMIVDLDDPSATASVVHPMGNHEDPDHPDLGIHFDDNTPDLWSEGTGPGDTATLGTFECTLSSTLPCSDLPYDPFRQYYGYGYNGPDPQKALSIEVLETTAPSPTDTIHIKISKPPAGYRPLIWIGTVQTNTTADDGDNTIYTIPTKIFGSSITESITVAYKIPRGFTGDAIYIQGIASRVGTSALYGHIVNGPPFPFEVDIQTTGGLKVRVD